MFGFGEEDVDGTIVPMATNGQEPTASMGNDTPLAVLSSHAQVFFNYFRQQFAQVTNPAIDSIRESLVMSCRNILVAWVQEYSRPTSQTARWCVCPTPF